MHNLYPHMFNVRAIIRWFGGVTATHKLLVKEGCGIKAKTIEKWIERGNIPSDVIATLAVIANRRGAKFDVCKFIVPRNGVPRNGEARQGSKQNDEQNDEEKSEEKHGEEHESLNPSVG